MATGLRRQEERILHRLPRRFPSLLLLETAAAQDPVGADDAAPAAGAATSGQFAFVVGPRSGLGLVPVPGRFVFISLAHALRWLRYYTS
ncbi:hypothetical protein [Streptomyces sp. NPDC059651]|uniref:hypothetical protein n=1 Tax=Streptomyces sp. NPDC059651 TaxID=3346897 RepID=UPI0036B8052A